MKNTITNMLILLCSVSTASAQNFLDNYVGATVTPTVIASSSNQVNEPHDLDFKPNSNELWVANRGTGSGGSTVIVYNAGTPSQTSQYRKDSHTGHFMIYPSAIAFGDDGFWGCTSEIQSTNGGNSTFMGPALWTSDTAIFAKVFQNNWVNGFPLGSHYDMLHQSPFAMGIAHDSAMSYWVSDGHNGNIVYYDYVQHHGPGYDNHSAGKIWRYIDVLFTRVPNIPSHMILDKATGWLYFIDGGPKKLKRVNTNSGTITGNLTTPSTGAESLALYKKVEGAIVEDLNTYTTQPCGIDFYNDRLVVSDYTTGDIYLYNTSGALTLLATISTGLPGMTGVKIGPDGRIWCVNKTTDNVYRLDIAGPAIDVAVVEINSPVVQNFKANFYSTAYNVCNGSITPEATIMNMGTSTITSVDLHYTIDNGFMMMHTWTGSLSAGATAVVTFPPTVVSNGSHLLSISAVSVNGGTDEVEQNNTIDGSFRTIDPPATYPFSEGFTSTTFPPQGWNYVGYNPNNKMSRVTVGGFGLSTGSMKMDNYSGAVDITGQEDFLISPVIDMIDATANSWLHFNVAHAKYNASSTDGLQVLVSTDCGNSWSSIYNKSGTALSTAPVSSSAWTPNSTQWRTDSVSMAAYAGQSEILFAFLATSNFGNNVYVDDILLSDLFTGISSPSLDLGLTISPNPVSSNLQIHFDKTTAGKKSGAIFSQDGKLVRSFEFSGTEEKVDVEVSSWPAGVYAVRIWDGTGFVVETFVKN